MCRYWHRLGRRQLRALTLSLLVLFPASVSLASADNGDSIRAQLAQYMNQAVTDEHFQGSVLVARGDEVLLIGGWGKADVDKGVENTSSTKFLIGSITKPFTAIAILQLNEKGLLELSDPISKYSSRIPAKIANDITIHHLLSHTSGLPDYVAMPAFQERAEKPITPDEIIDTFKDLPLRFKPGARFEYSSSGYVLLGQVIEKVTGQRYEDYIKENILAPLRMNNTGVFYDYATRKDFAVGYEVGNSGLIRSRIIHVSAGYSAGALGSTVEDLYLLDRALHGNGLLNRESIKKMLTPHTAGYGYGWSIGAIEGHLMTGHGGGTPGFITMFQRWVDDDLCVIVLCNNVSVSDYDIAVDLAALALGKPSGFQDQLNSASEAKSNNVQKVDVPETVLKKYAGVYQIDPPGFKIEITLREGVLYAEALGNPAIEMIPISNDEFSLRGLTAKILFRTRRDGLVNSLLFTQEGLEGTGTRIIE